MVSWQHVNEDTVIRQHGDEDTVILNVDGSVLTNLGVARYGGLIHKHNESF